MGGGKAATPQVGEIILSKMLKSPGNIAGWDKCTAAVEWGSIIAGGGFLMMFVKAIITQKLKEVSAQYKVLSTITGYLFQELPSELKAI